MPAKDQTVDSYISDRCESVQDILNALRHLIKSALPGVTEGMKWGAPVYSEPEDNPLVYLYGGKGHANIGFLRGAELDDPEKLLKGKGKSGRHIKVFSTDQIPEQAIRQFLDQCVNLK